MITRFIVLLGIAFACFTDQAEEAKPKVRISAWYWLNSAPKSNWEGDFVTMRNLGFTDVLLCWGLDLTGIVSRQNETKAAMQLAHKAGIGVYLIVWQPSANALKREPEFMQVNADGVMLDMFDTFNPKWRATQWRDYLHGIAKIYGSEPAMAGYVFDDSFGSGNISYGEYEQKQFGKPLPRKTTDEGWAEWTKLRQGWWEDWAKDTKSFIREIDPNTNHIVYLEDIVTRFTDKNHQAQSGVDFRRVARHFDAVGGYTTPVWTTNADTGAHIVKLSHQAIENVQKMVDAGTPVIYTFWSANIAEERNPGPAVHPTAAEIIMVCEDALKLGVKHLDMYGYRIGEYNVSRAEMMRMMPAEPAPYVLTGQFPQKFMWDRPEIQAELGAYLRGLNQK